MTSYAFRILNVFTVEGDRLSGNPLCVFEDARGLSDHQMQALARQMNLSETTFVLPAQRAACDAHVRIFTPGFEMPFAGHPTLGTAVVVAAGRDAVTLQEKAGDIAVTVNGDRATLRAAMPPSTRAPSATRAQLAAMVGLPERAIAGEPLWVTTGVEQLVIPVDTVAHVRAARPILALIEEHGFSEARNEAMAYLWARDPETNHLVVRFFFTSNGVVLEDPATGSACANLGGWMIATGAELPVRAMLEQGDAVGRPSRLELAVDASGEIRVTGRVVELARGQLTL